MPRLYFWMRLKNTGSVPNPQIYIYLVFNISNIIIINFKLNTRTHRPHELVFSLNPNKNSVSVWDAAVTCSQSEARRRS